MDNDEEMTNIEEVSISPIIQIFERVTFERGQEIHEQVTSMIELFSSSDITLDMLDILIECVKIIFVHKHTNKNIRLFEFLIALSNVTYISYTTNRNLSLVFDCLIDVFMQSMVATDSQIRYTALRVLNKLQTFIDLSESAFIPDQFEEYLLNLLNNETTLIVIDEIVVLAAKFQHKSHSFIDGLIHRINSPKWTSYLDRRRQTMSLLEYSPSSLNYLISTIENDRDLSQTAFQCLLSDERGFKLENLGTKGRSIVLKIASKSQDSAKFVFNRWLSRTRCELIHIIRLLNLSYLIENEKSNDVISIETCLKYFLDDVNIKQIVNSHLKSITELNKGGILSSSTPNYIEYLFLWRILLELINEDDDENTYPDFHELLSYFYRLIKSCLNENLSLTKQFILCQYISIFSKYDMIDTYRRKCIEALGRCLLVHFGHYETIIENCFKLIYRSIDRNCERYQLITYTLNDIIERCQNQQSEHITFIQCMTIGKLFIEKEKQFDLNNIDLKQLLDSLIKSGLTNRDYAIQYQTLSTLHSLMCHSKKAAIEYFQQNIRFINKVQENSIKCKAITIFLDVLLIHGLDILITENLSGLAASQFTREYLTNLFDQHSMEIKELIVFGLMKLLISSRLEANESLLRIILDYRFSNDNRYITQHQRDQITYFFYFFIHLSSSNVLLIEQLTSDLLKHHLPFLSNNSTTAYKTVLFESMSCFCIELLALPSLPIDKLTDEHSHYHLAKNLLESIHISTNNRTIPIIRCYLNAIKHFQFEYWSKEELEIIFDLINRIRQYPNLSSTILNSIRQMEKEIQTYLKLIDKLTNSNIHDKRSRSPSPISSASAKRQSIPRNILQDNTNQPMEINENNKLITSKGIKRKLNPSRFTTLDFENDIDDTF